MEEEEDEDAKELPEKEAKNKCSRGLLKLKKNYKNYGWRRALRSRFKHETAMDSYATRSGITGNDLQSVFY